jgi:phosphatidylinositol 4-kinase A
MVQIMNDSIGEMGRQVVNHSLPESLSSELQSLLVASCHRVESIRKAASKYLDLLIRSFPSLMCDPPLVTAILEVLTLLQKACAGEFTDEVNGLRVNSQTSNILSV